MQPHRGTIILVLGIIGLVTSCFPLGIIAWVMGNADLKEMNAGTMDPEGRGNTQVGKIIGMISTILGIIGFIVAFLLFGVALILPAVANATSLMI